MPFVNIRIVEGHSAARKDEIARARRRHHLRGGRGAEGSRLVVSRMFRRGMVCRPDLVAVLRARANQR
jgi:hypothetical protein